MKKVGMWLLLLMCVACSENKMSYEEALACHVLTSKAASGFMKSGDKKTADLFSKASNQYASLLMQDYGKTAKEIMLEGLFLYEDKYKQHVINNTDTFQKTILDCLERVNN